MKLLPNRHVLPIAAALAAPALHHDPVTVFIAAEIAMSFSLSIDARLRFGARTTDAPERESDRVVVLNAPEELPSEFGGSRPYDPTRRARPPSLPS